MAKRNSDDARNHATSILSFSLKSNSEMGVLIGEILENAIIQHGDLLFNYHLNNEQMHEEIDAVIKLIKNVRSTIQDDNEMNIYKSLATLRMYVTQQQLEIFPAKYTLRPRRRFA